MRLRCTVKVHSQNGVGISRPSASTLALVRGAKDSNCAYLLHFSSTNKFGKRYKLSENVLKVFTKFCGEGKTTISFKDPQIDLLIQADSVQLKVFLSTLSSCIRGNTEQFQLTSLDRLGSLGVVAKNTAPTKLIVLSAADIPIKGLPRTLQTLHMNGLQMCLFKREILALRNLQTLDLSNNNLEKLPPELGKMPCVTQLILNKNKLGNSTLSDWKWIEGAQIVCTLKSLDISSNTLQTLPKTISKLRSLVSLKLDDNNLTSLPMGIGSIRSLRFLSMSKNKLSVLPASISCLRLQQADFSFNSFNYVEKIRTPPNFKVDSLVELCSSIVVKHKITYAKNLIPYTLVDYLDNSNYCICGKPTFNSSNYLRTDLSLASFCESVTSNGVNSVSFECYLCSFKCYNYCLNDKRFNVSCK